MLIFFAFLIGVYLWSIGIKMHRWCIDDIFFSYYTKWIDSMLLCTCAPVHRRFQNIIRTSMTHSAMVTSSCATFCSYHISTSSAINYWTDAQQHVIYLLIWDRCFGSVLIMRAFAKLFIETLNMPVYPNTFLTITPKVVIFFQLLWVVFQSFVV